MQRKWPDERIPIDLEPIPGFNLRAQVVGQGGAYVKHIQQKTRCRVQIKGRNSGFIESSTGRESDEPMFLHVAYVTPFRILSTLFTNPSSVAQIPMMSKLPRSFAKTFSPTFESNTSTSRTTLRGTTTVAMGTAAAIGTAVAATTVASNRLLHPRVLPARVVLAHLQPTQLTTAHSMPSTTAPTHTLPMAVTRTTSPTTSTTSKWRPLSNSSSSRRKGELLPRRLMTLLLRLPALDPRPRRQAEVATVR